MNDTYTPGDRVTTPDGPGTVEEAPALMSSGWTVAVTHDTPVSASGGVRYRLDEISPAEDGGTARETHVTDPIDAVAPLPDDTDDLTAHDAALHSCARVLHGHGALQSLGARPDAQYLRVLDNIIGEYAIAHLLRALAAHAPDAADHAVRALYRALEAGGTTRELAWEWLADAGVTSDQLRALIAAGEEAARGPDQHGSTSADRPDLDAIRKRADAASGGPWEVDAPLTATVRSRGTGTPIALCGMADDPGVLADAEFITHAREDVPALLAEVDRLRAALHTARASHADQWGDDITCADADDAQLTAARDAVADARRAERDRCLEVIQQAREEGEDDLRQVIARIGHLPAHRTETTIPLATCATCEGGGCPDCTDPSDR